MEKQVPHTMEAESGVLGSILTAKKYQLTPSYIARLARNQTIHARKYGLGVLDDCLSHAFTAVTLARSAGSSKTEDRIKILYAKLAHSSWRKEEGVSQLGKTLSTPECENQL